MVALTVTAANVAYVSGPKLDGAKAGEALAAGSAVYYDTGTGTWKKAQCDGTAAEAGANGIGIALATADAAGAIISIALPGAIVSLGTGTAGSIYCVGTTYATLIPTADVATTNKVTIAAIGIGSNKVQVCGIYNAGAIAP